MTLQRVKDWIIILLNILNLVNTYQNKSENYYTFMKNCKSMIHNLYKNYNDI
jgi:hypothetical protein